MSETAANLQTVANPPVVSAPTSTLDRNCACGQHNSGGGECSSCRKHKLAGNRTAINANTHGGYSVNAPVMPNRFNHDFSGIAANGPLFGGSSEPRNPIEDAINPRLPKIGGPKLGGSTLPYREAKEVSECIRIMGADSADLCQEQVTGQCVNPGLSRTLDVQPVFFKNAANDPAPTGASWSRRLSVARAVWGKLGVFFNASAPVTLQNAADKTSGSTEAEVIHVLSLRNGPGVEVFMMDNDMVFGGGGATAGRGTPTPKIVLSDRGTSDTLLAHELGHVLGLTHPPAGADANTIMDPSNSNNADNPTRNTIGNLQRINFPAPGGPACLHPDR